MADLILCLIAVAGLGAGAFALGLLYVRGLYK